MDEKNELALEDSGIGWKDSTLFRYNKKGKKIGEFKAQDIHSLTLKSKINFNALYFFIGSAGGVYFFFTKPDESAAFRWTMTIIFAMMTFGAFFLIKQRILTIHTKTESISFEIEEPIGDAQAFVHSVEQKLKSERGLSRF